jgi:hypothetical protein
MYSTGGRVIIRNHVHGVVFTQVEKVEEPEQYLKTPKWLLDGLDLKWCFAFGTALGLYREKGFIPQDSDVDIMILSDGIDQEKVLDAFEKHYTLIRTVYYDGKYHQLAFQGKDNFIVDLCFFFEDGENYTSYCEGGYWKDPVDTIGGFKLFDTHYGEMPLPENIEDYLIDRYGEDWETPKYGLRACSNKET